MGATTFLPFLALVVAVYFWLTKSTRPKGVEELPGPRGLPILGNLIDFPRTFAWIKFKEWSHEYGPIFKVNVLGNTIIVVSEQHIADDLLTTRGANYSDRGALHMLALNTGGGDLVGAPQNDYWRRGRRFATAMTVSSMATQWEPFLTHEVKKMVMNLVQDTSKYEFWFERVSTVVAIRQGFGKTLVKDEDVEHHTDMIMAHNRMIEKVGAPGAYMVDIIPQLMYLPEALAPFKREAKQTYARDSAYFYGLVQEAIEKHQNGISEQPKSFSRCWAEKEDRWGLSFHEAAYVMGTLFGGGSGTTSGSMRSFCLAMCHHPEWMQKLNDELDAVVGHDRLPTFQDYPHLHLVRALVKETLRWRPVVPANVPHRVAKDDVYQGYHIPKGALIWANQWAIHRDPALYPDGESFNPDRWLNPKFPTFKEPLEQFPNIKRFSAFGFGRRICPGFEMAERSMFMQIAMLGWACRISKKVVNGVEVPVSYYDYTAGGQSFPKPFAFDVKPRDGRRLEMLNESWQRGLQEFKD